jgi:arylsulfatase
MLDRPHVLLITTDHWPAQLLGAAGHACIQTPTLDELARSGRRYSCAYSEAPLCVPARRALMTGRAPRVHAKAEAVPLLADLFSQNGYQTYAVGKLHATPQRSRLGFDDVQLCEEGRVQWGVVDDYEAYLTARGRAGAQFFHGMGNNEYVSRPWHLPEEMHATNWLTREMVRAIQRRDPTRPGLWYLSYTHPHPPLVPLEHYLNMYRELPVATPSVGQWAEDPAAVPLALRARREAGERFTDYAARAARRAFYALCTHIDHQLRIVLGTLREQGILDNTVILFTSDHGDMLGKHGLWAKTLYYEESACVPMLLVGAGADSRVGHGIVDDRLVGWQDVMPTLLELAEIAAPASAQGLSMVGDEQRDFLYGEVGSGQRATRMVRDKRYKLIYYAAGNGVQLFDLLEDPDELVDLAADPERSAERCALEQLLIKQLADEDEDWVVDGELVGLPAEKWQPQSNKGLTGQRGGHWPI